jgi:hypothetical protein
MVRVPRGLHRQAYRPGNKLAWRPGWRGTGMQPIRRLPVNLYQVPVTGVPLTGGQGQAVVSSGGAASVTVGPQGLGNVWYPAQVTVSTTSGVNDTSTCLVYLGSQGVPVTLLGTVYPGGAGTLGLAVPSMSPGQYLIAIWSGGNPGDVAAVNVIGTMDALTT